MNLTQIADIFTNPKYIWAAISFLTFVAVVITVIKLHLSPEYKKFDLIELFSVDQKTGKVSDSKVRLNIAFVLSCWAFVYLVMDSKFTEWYFYGFMGAWVTDRIFSRKSKDSGYLQEHNYNSYNNTSNYSTYRNRPTNDPDPYEEPDYSKQQGNMYRNG